MGQTSIEVAFWVRSSWHDESFADIVQGLNSFAVADYVVGKKRSYRKRGNDEGIGKERKELFGF